MLFFVALLAQCRWRNSRCQSGEFAATRTCKSTEELAVGERVFERLDEQRAQESARRLRCWPRISRFARRSRPAMSPLLSAARKSRRAHQGAGGAVRGSQGQVIADTLAVARAALRWFDCPGARRGPGDHHRTARSAAVPAGRRAGARAAPIGWIVVCFPLDATLAQDLRQLTGLEVSFALWNADHWTILASTLGEPALRALDARLPSYAAALQARELDLQDGPEQVRTLPIGDDGERLVAVLQRPMWTRSRAFGPCARH